MITHAASQPLTSIIEVSFPAARSLLWYLRSAGALEWWLAHVRVAPQAAPIRAPLSHIFVRISFLPTGSHVLPRLPVDSERSRSVTGSHSEEGSRSLQRDF